MSAASIDSYFHFFQTAAGSATLAATNLDAAAAAVALTRPPAPDSAGEFMRDVATVLPDLRRRARRLAKDPADADDLVQETCRRALEARKSFAAGTSLRAWMIRIMRNHHLDRLRQQRREVFLGDGMESVPAATVEEPPEWWNVSDGDAARAMEALPPLFRAAYALHAIRGLSYLQIARQLDIPCATVGTRLRRARLRLRSLLADRSLPKSVLSLPLPSVPTPGPNPAMASFPLPLPSPRPSPRPAVVTGQAPRPGDAPLLPRRLRGESAMASHF